MTVAALESPVGAGLVTAALFDDLIGRTGRWMRAVPVGSCGATAGELLELALAESGKGVLFEGAWQNPCVMVDQQPVKLDELYTTVVPAGSSLTAAPRPGDLVDVVLIGIALLSAAASVLIAGSVKIPKIAGGGEPKEKRFGFGRLAQPAFAGETKPVVAGRITRYGGRIIAKVPVEGEDGRERLKILVDLSAGTVEQIGNYTTAVDLALASITSGVYLQDQPIANFPDARISTRLGTGSQSVIPGFADTEVLREVGVGGVVLRNTSGSDRTSSSASGEAFLFTTLAAVHAVRIRARFTRGLYRILSSAQVDSVKVQYRWRWRLHDVGGGSPGSWSAWTVVSVERAEQSSFVSSVRGDNLNSTPAVIDVQLERITKEPTTADVADEVAWDSLVEINYSQNRYLGRALLAVTLVAGEQLTSEPQISVDVMGLNNLRLWDEISPPTSPVFTSGYSVNPADLALEVITNTAWGMGARYTDAEVDFESLLAWRTYCAEAVPKLAGGTRPRFAINLALTERREGWEVLRSICEVGRCVPIESGGKIRFVYDRPQSTPAEIFNDGVIAVENPEDPASAAAIEYEALWTEAGFAVENRLVAQVMNEDRDWQTEAVAWPPTGTLWLATEPVREKSVQFAGISNVEQAVSELKYRVKKRRFITKSVTFQTTKPIVVVRSGDRFDLSTSLPGWGLASGRLDGAGTSTTVKLDREVTLAAATTYTVTVIHDNGTAETRTVTSPAGTYAAGSAIAVTPAFASAPGEYEQYTLGKSGIAMKPFLCTRVRPIAAEEFRWEITGVEYAADVYDDAAESVSIPNYSTLPSASTPPGPLLELVAFERRVNGVLQVHLACRQSVQDAEMTASFRIYRRRVGSGVWIAVPDAAVGVSRRGAVVELADGDFGYQFIMVAVSSLGSALSPDDPRHPIAVLVYGLSAPPPPVPALDSPATVRDGSTGSYALHWLSWEEAFVGPPPLPDATPTESFMVMFGTRAFLGTVTPPGGFAYDTYSHANCVIQSRPGKTVRSVTGLRLAVGQPYKFYVRSVGANGRMNVGIELPEFSIASPVAPPGKSVKGTRTFALNSEGTLTNLTWDGTNGWLRQTSSASPGIYLSPEVDLTTVTASELMVWFNPGNAAEDPALNTNPFQVPSIEADQWGVVSVGPAVVKMLCPPYPDDRQALLVEARTYDGAVWSDWTAIAVGQSISRLFRKYQIRVTLSRSKTPYRPALRGLVGVVVH
ncbi:MAG: hypothetical protein IT435_16125 [Phycisphaerales bacterium]|nr:hypothetical protein [Phycisphaerales bacterium]